MKLCEICQVYDKINEKEPICDVYIINYHYEELYRNRLSRENKNINPKNTVF